MVAATLPVLWRLSDDPDSDILNAPLGKLLWCSTLTAFVGTRFEVGGDWLEYSQRIDLLRGSELGLIFTWDPGYDLLNWLAANLFYTDVVFVNVICGAIFSLGVIEFCRALPKPSLAFLLSLPYLVFVVGMGYTRQAAAIGLVMYAASKLGRSPILTSVIGVAFAAIFHKAAAVFLPIFYIAGLPNGENKKVVVIIATLLVLLFLLYSGAGERLIRYLSGDWSSTGAAIRGFLNLGAAILFLKFSDHFNMASAQKKLFQIMSAGMFVAACLLLLSPASTLLDRMGLFFLPFQIGILATLPLIFNASRSGPKLAALSLVTFSWIQLLLWFTFSPNAIDWLPYRSAIFA
jgi:hypothetical protein